MLLWRKDVDSMIQKWSFNESVLVLGTQSNIVILDAAKGLIIDQKKLIDLYDEASVKRTRTDNYVEIVDIKSISGNQRVSVLITEPVKITEFKNNVLYLFGKKLNIDKQVIKIGDSEILPTLKKSDKELLIIKDNEILKYGF